MKFVLSGQLERKCPSLRLLFVLVFRLFFFCLFANHFTVCLLVCLFVFFRFRIAGSAVVLATLVYPPVLANTHLGRKKKRHDSTSTLSSSYYCFKKKDFKKKWIHVFFFSTNRIITSTIINMIIFPEDSGRSAPTVDCASSGRFLPPFQALDVLREKKQLKRRRRNLPFVSFFFFHGPSLRLASPQWKHKTSPNPCLVLAKRQQK